MQRIGMLAIAATLVFAPGARAQESNQLVGALAAGAQTLGQSLGGVGNVFVTATGRAPLSTPAAIQAARVYTVTIQGRAASAVEAARQYDAHLAAARKVATQFHIEITTTDPTFGSEFDNTARLKRAVQARAAATPGSTAAPIVPFPDTDADRLFIEQSQVRFVSSDPAQFPAFLDALKAAGVDDASFVNIGAFNVLSSAEIMGFGNLPNAEQAVWDRAASDAMADARRQAQALAAASGRALGEVRQVSLLARSVQGGEARVTLAVSFNFAAPK